MMTLKTLEDDFQDLLRMSAGFCRLPTIRCKMISQERTAQFANRMQRD